VTEVFIIILLVLFAVAIAGAYSEGKEAGIRIGRGEARNGSYNRDHA
jgi:hypothetical protein